MTGRLSNLSVIIAGMAGLIFTATSTMAGTVELTSVDQLDLDGVLKAYDFTFTANEGTFDIGGVTFTRYNWGKPAPSNTFDGLTLSNHLVIDNQGSGAPNITLGGTATDRANLNALLDCWNIGGGGDIDLSIQVPRNGLYKVQYIVGTSGARDNEVFDITAGAPGTSLGAWNGGTKNFLITADIKVTSGTIDLRVKEGIVAGGDNRRVVSGLIIKAYPPAGTVILVR